MSNSIEALSMLSGVTINNYIAALSMISGAIALIYSAKQLTLLLKTHVQNHDWNRRKAAQDATINLNKELSGLGLLNRKFNLLDRNQPIETGLILAAIADKDDGCEIHSEINRVLNTYEAIARGVIHKVYDEEIIRDARGVVMASTYRSFEKYIIFRRNGTNVDTAWGNFENLVLDWKKKGLKAYNHREKTGNLGN